MSFIESIKKKSTDEIMLISFVLLAIGGIVGGLLFYFSASSKTKRLVKKEAIKHRWAATEESKTLAVKDGWGRPVKLEYTWGKYEEFYKVVSPGKDGVFGTKDDISHTEKELNKSRIVGKWMTDKTTEALKGAKDSIKDTFKGDPNEPKEEGEPFSKKVGKKIGETIKNIKEGFKEGKEKE